MGKNKNNEQKPKKSGQYHVDANKPDDASRNPCNEKPLNLNGTFCFQNDFLPPINAVTSLAFTINLTFSQSKIEEDNIATAFGSYMSDLFICINDNDGIKFHKIYIAKIILIEP